MPLPTPIKRLRPRPTIWGVTLRRLLNEEGWFRRPTPRKFVSLLALKSTCIAPYSEVAFWDIDKSISIYPFLMVSSVCNWVLPDPSCTQFMVMRSPRPTTRGISARLLFPLIPLNDSLWHKKYQKELPPTRPHLASSHMCYRIREHNFSYLNIYRYKKSITTSTKLK